MLRILYYIPMHEIGQNQRKKGGWAYITSWAYITYSTVVVYCKFGLAVSSETMK